MRRLKENWVWWLGAVLLVNSGYLFARNDASIPYVVNVVLHAVLGVGVAAIGAKWLVGRLRDGNALLRLAVVLMVAGIAFGFVIFFTGATRPFRWIVHTHLGLMAAGV
ncbi:MAG: hypothetical protein O3A46_12800, partial [Candidatus Poribacteria bacterium]|nr:hypothetical protein [Candidatus Poribacteria bacterium]